MFLFPLNTFQAILDRLEDESDLRDIREAKSEPLYDQKEAESYIFMNPVKRKRLERGWTQDELANRIGVKQATVANGNGKALFIAKQPDKSLLKSSE